MDFIESAIRSNKRDQSPVRCGRETTSSTSGLTQRCSVLRCASSVRLRRAIAIRPRRGSRRAGSRRVRLRRGSTRSRWSLSGICLLLRVGGRPRGKLCVAGLRTRRAWHSPWTCRSCRRRQLLAERRTSTWTRRRGSGRRAGVTAVGPRPSLACWPCARARQSEERVAIASAAPPHSC
jgi:hypothetical protein